MAALEGIGRPVVLIAGGDGKGQDFAPLRPAVDAHCRAVLLIGRDAPALERALAGTRATVERCGTLDAAVARAIALARPGDAVLLSPACASLDQFANYVERGDRFARARPRADCGGRACVRTITSTAMLRPFAALTLRGDAAARFRATRARCSPTTRRSRGRRCCCSRSGS